MVGQLIVLSNIKNVMYAFFCSHLAAIPFSPALLGCIPWNDILSCRFYVILKILYSSWHRFLLCSCVNNLLSKAFAFLANIIARSADLYMGQPDISMRDLQGPYICDSSQDCRYLWWTSFFVSDAERYIGGIPSLHGASGCVMPNSTA